MKILGEERIKREIVKATYELEKATGELELLVLLVREGKEIGRAKERLPHYSELNERLALIVEGVQRSKPKEQYLIDFNKQFSNSFQEYKYKLKQLEELMQ